MKRINKITIKHILDTDADLSWIGEFSDTPKKGAIEHQSNERHAYKYFNPANPEYAKQEYEEMQKINNGELYFIGIKADAETATSEDGNTWKLDHITSSGLWGIETSGSKDDEKYIEEEEKNQLAELRDILKEYGFTETEIAKAPIEFDRLP